MWYNIEKKPRKWTRRVSLILVSTTQVNSAFGARWLASWEVISQALFTFELWAARETSIIFLFILADIAVFGAIYSTCVVFTKTIIHLGVGE